MRARKGEWERGRDDDDDDDDDDDAEWREEFSTTEMWELQRNNPTGGPPKMSLMDVSHRRSHHFPTHNLSLESHGRSPGLAG